MTSQLTQSYSQRIKVCLMLSPNLPLFLVITASDYHLTSHTKDDISKREQVAKENTKLFHLLQKWQLWNCTLLNFALFFGASWPQSFKFPTPRPFSQTVCAFHENHTISSFLNVTVDMQHQLLLAITLTPNMRLGATRCANLLQRYRRDLRFYGRVMRCFSGRSDWSIRTR